LEIKPDDPRALHMAAWNAYEMRDHKKAIQLLERYCQLSPANSYPWKELARIYEQHRNYKKAISYMEEAVKREPNNWVIWEDLGRYYFMAGDDTKAVACRSKAMELKAKYRPRESL
jgi:tetratricopeptide (TPR) repeat protein